MYIIIIWLPIPTNCVCMRQSEKNEYRWAGAFFPAEIIVRWKLILIMFGV